MRYILYSLALLAIILTAFAVNMFSSPHRRSIALVAKAQAGDLDEIVELLEKILDKLDKIQEELRDLGKGQEKIYEAVAQVNASMEVLRAELLDLKSKLIEANKTLTNKTIPAPSAPEPIARMKESILYHTEGAQQDSRRVPGGC